MDTTRFRIRTETRTAMHGALSAVAERRVFRSNGVHTVNLYAGQAEAEIEFRLFVSIATGCTLLLFTSIELSRRHWLARKMSVCFAFECNHNSFRESCRFFRFPKNAQKRNIWIAASRYVFSTSYTTSTSYTRPVWRMTSAIMQL